MGNKLRQKDYRRGYEDGWREALALALELVKKELENEYSDA